MASRSRARRSSLQTRYLVIAAVLAAVTFALLVSATNWNLTLTWVLAWTPVAFALYGYDKMQARRHALRVPEISLLVVGVAGGCGGALAGMFLFRHKTAKLKFWVVNLLSGALYVVLLIVTGF